MRLDGHLDGLDALLSRLLERASRGAKLGRERVNEALDSIGSPHATLPCVHIAGTNGKGSTCAMVESIARAAGLRTGMYSSPHLERFNERIRICGEPIDDDSFARVLQPLLSDAFEPLSFFEVLTVAALWAMSQAKVELAILEVGLGGRLDATNVVERPLCTAITSIGIDHTRLLGNDIADIAREKAGIAKPGVPLVLGPVDNAARAAIHEVAIPIGSHPLLEVSGDDLADSSATAIASSLAGAHQRDNAAVALAIASFALPALGKSDWETHADTALAAARWPGRLEAISRNGVQVLLDCAHNLAALDALQRAIAPLPHDRTLLVFGAMSDKPWQSMLERLAPVAPRRFYAEAIEPIAGRHAVTPAALSKVADGQRAPSPAAAIELALGQASPGDTVLVTGSIFLVGAVRAALLGERRDVAVPL